MPWSHCAQDLSPPQANNLVRQRELFWEHGDSANAVAIDEILAPIRYRNGRAGFPQFDASLPAIVSSFMPKSGGTFLHNRMLEIGYMEYWWGVAHRRAAANVYALPKALELYLAGGCTSHTHAQPHPHTLEVFDRIGLDRMWVHVRHPAEAAVSAFYHYQGEGQGHGAIGAKRVEQARADAERLGVEAELDAFMQNRTEFMVNWIRSWAEFAARHPDRMYVTYHHELSDAGALLGKVLAVFGGADQDLAVTANRPDDRRRLTERVNWRDGLSAQTILQIERLLHERLSGYALLEPIWKADAR